MTGVIDPSLQPQQQTQTATQDPKYNWIYKKLAPSPEDAVGAFAYMLYKEDKIAYIEDIFKATGKNPTAEDLSAFHRTSCLPTVLEGYRERAQLLVNDFLQTALRDRIKEMEESVKNNALGTKFDGVVAQLNEKKTLAGWGRDVGTNIFVNFLTIVIIGAIILGYKSYSSWSAKTESFVGITQEEAKQQPNEPSGASAPNSPQNISPNTPKSK